MDLFKDLLEAPGSVIYSRHRVIKVARTHLLHNPAVKLGPKILVAKGVLPVVQQRTSVFSNIFSSATHGKPHKRVAVSTHKGEHGGV